MKKILFILSLLLLTGCAGRETADIKKNIINDSAQLLTVTDREDLNIEYNKLDNLQMIEENFYYSRYEKSENGHLILLCCRKEKNAEEEILYTYGDEDVIYYMSATKCDREGNWYNLLERRDSEEEKVFLEKLDASGNLIFSSQVGTYENILLTESVLDCEVSKEGLFYVITMQGTLLVWNQQGEEQFSLSAWTQEETSQWVYSGLVDGDDAGTYIYHTKGNQIWFNRIDTGRKLLAEFTKVDIVEASQENGLPDHSDSGDYETVSIYGSNDTICYLVSEESLFSYSFENGETEKILNWSDPYVNIDRHEISMIENLGSSFAFLCYDPTLGMIRYLTVESKSVDEIQDKTVIKLGYSDNGQNILSNIEEKVKRYNAQSEQYQIQIISYQDADSQDSLDELTTTLLQGKGPDLIELAGEAADYYAVKGVMEDLSPYLESSGIRLLEQVEEALRKDGKLYTLGAAFAIQGLIVPNEYIVDSGLSIAQCVNMIQDYPDAYPGKNEDRSTMLSRMLQADMDRYVDLEAGTCCFDGEEFIWLLSEISSWKDAPSDQDFIIRPEEIFEKKYLMEDTVLLTMTSYMMIQDTFGEFATFTGYPNLEGEEKYFIYFPCLFAINSASQNKEGAWDFLEYLLSENEERRYTSFPITQNMFEEKLKEAQEKAVDTYNMYTDEVVKGLQLTQEGAEQLWRILEHVDFPGNKVAVINNIISEEASAVFKGDKTPEQAAKIIQSRVSLFLQE